MAKVTGIGGVFFKAENPGEQYAWYEKHLGVVAEPDGSGAIFPWLQADDPKQGGMTVWSIFPRQSPYFGPEANRFMVNFRVDDLDALLEKLATEGVEIDPKRENFDYGKFAWIVDPEGNRIELWEPPKES